MIKKLKPKSEFKRNVLTLITGTTLAQIIPILVMPILTRLYLPVDFGTFGLFMSIVSLLTILSTGRYDSAIILPDNDISAANILVGSLFISLVFSFIVFIVIFILYSFLMRIPEMKMIGWMLFLIPFMILLTAVFQIFYNWLNRKKEYKNLSLSRIVINSSAAAIKFPFGYLNLQSFGLIIGQVIGQGVGTLYMMFVVYRSIPFRNISKEQITDELLKYSKFPKFDIASSFLNTLAFQLPILILGFLFSPAIVGFFILSRSVAGLPVTLFATSVATVFKERITTEYNKTGNVEILYIKTLRSLVSVAILPSMVLFIIAPDLFAIIFGEEWKKAGEYTQILIPMLFLRFVSSPLSYLVYIKGIQHFNFIIQGSLVLLITIGLYIGYIFNDEVMAILLYSFSFSIIYLIYLYKSYKLSKGV